MTRETITTEIEIYDVKSLPDEILDPEETEKIKALSEELGLEGLGQILDSEGIIPYRRLSKGEYVTFTAAFPFVHKPEDFKQVIPLRVLETLKHCKDKEYFQKYQIIHTQDVDKDPVLLGRTDTDSYRDDGWYMIARWGSSLISEKEIEEMAIANLREKAVTSATTKISEMKSIIENIDTHLKTYLKTGERYKAGLSDISLTH